MAAGKSSRMGFNKLIIRVEGEPLITRALKATKDFERVVIVGENIRELYEYIKDDILIYNPHSSKGISTSIKLGIRYFSEKEWIMFFPADMPLITSETVAKLCSHISKGIRAIIPVYNGIYGNPVLINRDLFTLVETIEGDVGARRIIRGREDVLLVKMGEEVIVDLDKKEDIEYLIKRGLKVTY